MRPAKFAAALAATALLTSGLAASARADQVFTDLTSFQAAMDAGSYTETFDGLYDSAPLWSVRSPSRAAGTACSRSQPQRLLRPGEPG